MNLYVTFIIQRFVLTHSSRQNDYYTCGLRTHLMSNICVYKKMFVLIFSCGPGSSVGIVTDNGLDGPGSNFGGDEIFRPSRPVLGPTQHPVKSVSGLSRG